MLQQSFSYLMSKSKIHVDMYVNDLKSESPFPKNITLCATDRLCSTNSLGFQNRLTNRIAFCHMIIDGFEGVIMVDSGSGVTHMCVLCISSW